MGATEKLTSKKHDFVATFSQSQNLKSM